MPVRRRPRRRRPRADVVACSPPRCRAARPLVARCSPRGWAILGRGARRATTWRMWCRTQALRYLPGGIWAPASRVVLVGGSAVDKVATVAAENIDRAVRRARARRRRARARRDGRCGRCSRSRVRPAARLRLARRPRRARIGPGAGAARDRQRRCVAFVGYARRAVLVQAAVSGWHDPLLVAGAARHRLGAPGSSSSCAGRPRRARARLRRRSRPARCRTPTWPRPP